MGDKGDEGVLDLSLGEDEARPNTAATETKKDEKRGKGAGTETKRGKKASWWGSL